MVDKRINEYNQIPDLSLGSNFIVDDLTQTYRVSMSEILDFVKEQYGAAEIGDHKISALSSDHGVWLKCDGRTIGSATSGATARANADVQELFELLWGLTTNSELAIQTSSGSASSRGASAADDFAADKRLPLPDAREEFLRVIYSGRALYSKQSSQNLDHTHGSGTYSTSEANAPHNHPAGPLSANNSNVPHNHALVSPSSPGSLREGGWVAPVPSAPGMFGLSTSGPVPSRVMTDTGDSPHGHPVSGNTASANAPHSHPVSSGSSGPSGGTEARPRNIALGNVFIKFK